MAKTNFDALMTRYLTNDVTEEERAKIDAWLKMLESGHVTADEMTDEEQEVLFEKIKSRTHGIEAIKTYVPDSLKKQKRSRWTWRLVAGLFTVVFAGLIAWRAVDKINAADIASAGMHKIILNDGTLVWLQGESSVNYTENSQGRYAELNGTALFEVTKDPAHPFIISYKEVNIRVVGTSFSLKTGDSLELKVLTGKVNISTSSDKEGVNIIPNEKALYTTSGGIVKLALSQADAAQAIADTEYNMNFTNATFKEIAERIGKKFDVTVRLTKREMENCHLTMDITDYSLDASLELITEILHVTYEKKGNTISFAGTGCK